MGAALVLVTGAATAESSSQIGSTSRESFELGMGGWVPDTDGRAKAWKIYRTNEQAHDGTNSLGLFIDGSYDEGTIWVERAIPTQRNTTVKVAVSFWLRNFKASNVNFWGVTGFAGTRDPETQFDMWPAIGITDQKPGWVQHSFTRTVKTDNTGIVWVATGLRATWETIRTYHLDLVETTITPQ
jgi:hypothetical protein